MIRAFLYDAAGKDREIALEGDVPPTLEEEHILWVDVEAPTDGEFARLKAVFGLGAEVMAALRQPGARFALDNYQDYFHCDVQAVVRPPDGERVVGSPIKGARLDFIVAPQWLITVHAEPLDFLEKFRAQDKGETMIGALTGPQVAASLLDWHLEAFLGAMEDLEKFIDGVDARILLRTRVREGLLDQVMRGRRHVSALRRMLAPQRSIFYGVSRPDFTHVAKSEAAVHFAALERRFERALGAIDHGRDLMQSSFDLFATRTAETTNMLIRRLTFLSLMLGGVAAVACLLSMDVPQPLANIGGAFWMVVGALALTAAAGVVIGRWRKWI